MNLTFERLSEVNARRSPVAFPKCRNWIPEQWSNAAAGEMGEACNKIKKRFGREDESVTLEMIGEEIADTIIYLDLLATKLDIDLPAAVIRKFNIISDEYNCTIKL